MHIVWEEENSEIPTNDSEATVQSKDDTEPTSSLDQPQVMHDKTHPSNDCTVSMNKPCACIIT